MSTPSDLFNSDNNDPQRRDAATPADTPDRDQAPAADTGAQHRVTQQPVGERWQPPQPPQAPRWKAAPHQSGPIPQAPQQGTVPVPRPAPPQVPPPYQPFAGQDPAGPPPNSEPHNNSGSHHRPPQQGQPYPPAAPAPQSPPQSGQSDPAASAAAPARRDEPGEYDERTSVISPEHLAEARELAGFFNEPVEAGSAPQAAGPQFSGPMGGEPFVPAGYGNAVATPDQVAAPARRIDPTGWRKAVQVMTFGLIKPGPSAKQIEFEELIRRIRASLTDVFVVAFVNSKGGVGKTTVAVAVGNAIARQRGDRVIVADVDTDLGNLSARFFENGGPQANIEQFATQPKNGSYSNVRRFTVQNDDRLEMLSSQNDPTSSYRLSSNDFEATMRILRGHYNVVLLDCGTSITSPLFATIANQVDCLVVVASQDAPGLNGASRTRAWLASHGLGRLLPRTVVVLNRTGAQKPKVDVDDAVAQFREGTEHVLTVPFDDHLSEGGAIEYSRMDKKTQKSVDELAGAIARYYPTRHVPRTEETGGY
ncbi:MinD/ParA family ATP-binding protein [Mycolicibacterium fortuitum]|uniref:MinD/ParA family ATP-binding protein n=1 Tax=Mycolicibacterium fortuitum TaxID=1766 RepID=UPI003AB09F64